MSILDELNNKAIEEGVSARKKRFFSGRDIRTKSKKKALKSFNKPKFPKNLGLLNYNDPQIEFIKDRIFEKIDDGESAYRSKCDKFDEEVNIYNLDQKSESNLPFPGCPEFATGYLASACDVLAAKMHKALIEPKPVFNAVPTLPFIEKNDDYFEKLKNHTDFMHYHNEVVDNIDEPSVNMFLSTARHGQGIIKVIQEYKEDFLKDYATYETLEELEEDGHDLDYFREHFPTEYRLLLEQKKPIDLENNETVIINRPKYVFVSLRDIRTDAIKSFDDSSYIIEKFKLNYFDMEKRFNTGVYYKELKKKYFDADKDKRKQDVFEPWEGIIVEKNVKTKQYEKFIVTLDLEKREILRCQKFYYIHNKFYYVNFRILPKENSYEGYGLIEMAKKPNQRMEDLLKYAYGQVEMAASPIKVVANNSPFSQETHPFKPNAVWRFNDARDVNLLELSKDPGNAIFNLIQMSQSMQQSRIGITDSSFGSPNALDPGAPAKKTIALLNEVFIHVDLYIKMIRRSFNDLAKIVSMNYYQFNNGEISYLSFGEEKIFKNKISSDELRNEVYFTLAAQTSLSNIDSESFFLMELYKIMLSDQSFLDYEDKRIEVVRDWARVNNVKMYDKYLPTKDQVEEKMIVRQEEAIKRIRIEDQNQEIQDREKYKKFIAEEEIIQARDEKLRDEGAMDALSGDKAERDQEYSAGLGKGNILADLMLSGIRRDENE